jgi:prepilin-type N-terminal cleavage/methylation domain-containing protein
MIKVGIHVHEEVLKMILWKRNKGFTLIELMIVIAIIGILAAIAIPQFAAYRTRGFNATALSDIRNMITIQEAYFADQQTYTANLANLVAFGFKVSPNVTATVVSANNMTYQMNTRHASGDHTYTITGPMGLGIQ